MPPLFSVIVPTRNRPQLLAEALGSIRAQTVTDFECIVVDDGSTTPPIPDDDRFRVLRAESHLGVAAATNLGLAKATGRYVAFLDDDDLWTPERLELGLCGLEHAPIAICWRADLASGVAGRNRRLYGNVHDVILGRSVPTKGQIAVVRERMLPFDARLSTSADVEWWLRISAVVDVYTVDRVGLFLRRHPGARNSARLVERVRCRRLIFDIHRDYFKRRPAIAASFLYRTGRIAQWGELHKEAIDLLKQSLAYRPSGRAAARLSVSVTRRAASIRGSARNVEAAADQLLHPSTGGVEQTAD